MDDLDGGGVEVPFAMFGGEVAEEDPSDACLIAPVAAGGGGGLENGGLGIDPVLHQMIKTIKAPKFDDTPEAWPSFIWDFERYLKKLSPKKEICNASKLHLLEECMPRTLQQEIRLMEKSLATNCHFWM